MAVTDDENSLQEVTQHSNQAPQPCGRIVSPVSQDGNDDDENQKKQKLDDDPKHQIDIISTLMAGSNIELDDEKNWNNMDSVHSRASSIGFQSSEGSFDFNESCSSFASFGGGSETSDNDSSTDLSVQKAAFTLLQEEPTPPPAPVAPPPRRKLMKTPSVRLTRGLSFRGSALTLIDESNSLD